MNPITVYTMGLQGPTGAQGPAGPTGDSQWNIFRNTISAGETAVVPSGSFLLGVESLLVEGTLDNYGKVLVI